METTQEATGTSASPHGPSPTEPGFSATLIAIVILRNAEGKFAATHEHDGWYLPAGRVDEGEGFATGAVREALEEAGVHVRLTGILRIEHTPGMRGSRMRVIYAAEPVDDSAPLKSVPDHEIIEAKWVTPEELAGLPLRAKEVKTLFNWARAGTRLFPASLIESEDSKRVNHCKVQVNLVAAVEAVVADGTGRYLGVKGSSGKWNIPSAVLTRPRQFKLAAAELLKDLAGGALLHMDGLLKVYYFPPSSPHNPNPTGFIKAVFLASVDEKSKDVALESHEGVKWLSAQEWEELGAKGDTENGNAARLVALAASTPRDQVAPVEVLAMELEPLKVL